MYRLITIIIVLVLFYPLFRDWNKCRIELNKQDKELFDDIENILNLYLTACNKNNDTPLEDPTLIDIMNYFKGETFK